MQNTDILLLLAGVAAGAMAVFLFTRRKQEPELTQELRDIMQRMDGFKDALSNRFSEELHRMRQEMATHLGSNREAVERSGQALHKQLIDFTAGVTTMSGALQEVRGSLKDIASFQDILRTPKLRGQWGEASLEHLLQEFFPPEFYERQKYFKSGEAVDAVLKIPDGKILPIDSKFPLENFQRMIQAEDEAEKIRFKKLFLDDARREIDSVSSKYILPSEGTTDFALLYIPAESVYYEIVNNTKETDLNDYARKKRLLLVSPNTFYLTLQILQTWLRDVRVSHETKDILKRLSRIMQDAEKLEEGFRRLGGHLTNAKGSYDDTEKRLSLMVDRAKNLMGSDSAMVLESPKDISQIAGD